MAMLNASDNVKELCWHLGAKQGRLEGCGEFDERIDDIIDLIIIYLSNYSVLYVSYLIKIFYKLREFYY